MSLDNETRQGDNDKAPLMLDLTGVPPVPVRMIHADEQIRQAIEDASLLLAYSVQSRASPDVKIIGELSAAIESLLNTPSAVRPSAEQQTDFWLAYDSLAAQLAPVSAFTVRETIRLRTTKGWRGNPPRWMATVAIIVFMCAMALQFTWVSGKELEDNTSALRRKQGELDQRIWKNRDEMDDLQWQLIGLGNSEHAPQPIAPGRNAVSTSSTQEFQLKTAMYAKASQLDRLDRAGLREQEQLNDARKRQQDATSQWYRLCPLIVCGPIESEKSIAELEKEIAAERKRIEEKYPGTSIGWDSGISISGDSRNSINRASAQGSSSKDFLFRRDMLQKLRALESRLQSARQENVNKVEQQAHLLLAALGTYAIPMLLGWLGAVTFMLRRLVMQLNESSYSPVSPSLGLVRMCLGMIVGVLGGLVVPATGTNLPPLALPFVFGYGIEIVFAGLDRIVKAFTENKDNPQQPLQR